MMTAPRMRETIARSFETVVTNSPIQIVPSGNRWRRIIVNGRSAYAIGASAEGLSTPPVDADAFRFTNTSPEFILPPNQALFAVNQDGDFSVTLTVLISDVMPTYIDDTEAA